MKIVVLDSSTLGKDICLDPLQGIGELVIYDNTLPLEIKERVKDAEVVITNKCKLNIDNLNMAKKLKLICVTATGFDIIDTSFCKDNNIAVANVPLYSTDSVVQVTLSLVLALSVRLKEYSLYVSNGFYSNSSCSNYLEYSWNELKGKTWGIVGGGAIGQKVASFASLFGCRVLMYRRKKDEKYKNATIEEIAKTCDIITIHLPLNRETRGLINKDLILKMKDSVILVNTSRGSVTDEEGIARAIENKEIGAFGCDVYSTEPFTNTHPFYRIKNYNNVILTPHMAWSAIESRNRCIYEVGENIKAFFRGEKRNLVVY